MEDRDICYREDGVDDGTRTHDGRNHNPGLYQLSYAHHRSFPICIGIFGFCRRHVASVARPAGLEPATPGLEGRCSIQLSYGRNSTRVEPLPWLEHYPKLGLGQVVGAEGFEPPTLCSQSRCATRLRHAPTALPRYPGQARG